MDFGELPGDLEEGDRLFGVNGPWQFNVKVLWDFLRDHRYVEGFRRAAEALGDHVATHRGDVDEVALPILFCYRQWLELRLKDLWLQGATLRSLDVDPLGTHDLKVLWQRVRPVLEDVWPEGDRAELDRLEAILHELADLDGPTGTGFRYATDKKGRASLPDDLDINLFNVRKVMDKVAVLLDGAAEGLAVMLEHQSEIRSYHGD